MIRKTTAVLEETLALADQVRLAFCAPGPEVWLQLDLSVRHLAALILLTYREALHVSGLATLLGASGPTASQVVDELVRRELVSRTEDPEDRRRTIVRLTAAGHAAIERLYGRREHELRGALGPLAVADLQALLQGLRALAGKMERANARGPWTAGRLSATMSSRPV